MDRNKWIITVVHTINTVYAVLEILLHDKISQNIISLQMFISYRL